MKTLGFQISNFKFQISNCLIATAAWFFSGVAPAAEPPAEPAATPPKAAAWHAVRTAEVKTQIAAWLEAAKVEEGVKAKINAIWAAVPETATSTELLDKLAESVALAEPAAAKLVELCSKSRTDLAAPPQPWLTDAKTPPLVAKNMRLYFARWLVQNSLYDEAGEQLAGLKPADVVAPAELLFYQGVVAHRLLHKEEGTKVIDQLLEGAEASPRRYVAVARLMQIDLAGLDPESLDHIARRMSDVERRLDLGRAGPKVRGVEDSVIESLDKLIKKLEDQAAAAAAAASNQGNLRPSSPAQRSTPKGGSGPGEIVRRNIGSKSGWGNLNAKQREETIQQIGREFPAHLRELIEQYYRRLASEESSEKP
jgi:hypothetical protein